MVCKSRSGSRQRPRGGNPNSENALCGAIGRRLLQLSPEGAHRLINSITRTACGDLENLAIRVGEIDAAEVATIEWAANADPAIDQPPFPPELCLFVLRTEGEMVNDANAPPISSPPSPFLGKSSGTAAYADFADSNCKPSRTKSSLFSMGEFRKLERIRHPFGKPTLLVGTHPCDEFLCAPLRPLR